MIGDSYIYMKRKNFSLLAAGACIFSFEIGGFLGSLFAGWLSDKVFEGKRGPVNALFSLGVIFATVSIWFTPVSGVVYAHIMMFFIGFLVFGPQMMIGIAAAELSHKKAAGAATGFVGWFAYVGATAAGILLVKLQKIMDGMYFFILLFSLCYVVLFLFFHWFGFHRRRILFL